MSGTTVKWVPWSGRSETIQRRWLSSKARMRRLRPALTVSAGVRMACLARQWRQTSKFWQRPRSRWTMRWRSVLRCFRTPSRTRRATRHLPWAAFQSRCPRPHMSLGLHSLKRTRQVPLRMRLWRGMPSSTQEVKSLLEKGRGDA